LRLTAKQQKSAYIGCFHQSPEGLKEEQEFSYRTFRSGIFFLWFDQDQRPGFRAIGGACL